MFTASSAPVTSRCRPCWSTIFCFRGPLRRSPRVCLRFFGPCFFLSACGPFGAARCAFFFWRVPLFLSLPGPAGPSLPSRRLVAPRAPRLSLRTCRLTPARCSALPRAPPAALLCFVRGLLRPALRRLACSSRRSACGAPLSSCLVFFSCPPPEAASHPCPSSRSLCCRSGSQVPAFVFAFPAAFGGFFPRLCFSCLFLFLARRLWRPFLCLCFCLALFGWAILMVVFGIFFSFYCLWYVYRTVGEKGRISNREKAKGKGMVRRGGRMW